MGATIYFDNLQSGEVAQLLSSMGHHTVGLKLHRRGDRSPEPGQAWEQEAFGARTSEVVLVSLCMAALRLLACLALSPLWPPCSPGPCPPVCSPGCGAGWCCPFFFWSP